jgi:hypothetical protein
MLGVSGELPTVAERLVYQHPAADEQHDCH